MDFGWRTVDFVGEDEVGEDRPFFGVERTVILSIGERSDEVGGQEIGGELNASELAIDDASERIAKQRFGEPRHAF